VKPVEARVHDAVSSNHLIRCFKKRKEIAYEG
jgi:hypothetical protein